MTWTDGAVARGPRHLTRLLRRFSEYR